MIGNTAYIKKRERYPRVLVDCKKLNDNIRVIKSICDEHAIEMAAVVKGCDGYYDCISHMGFNDIDIIASSRLRHLVTVPFLKGNKKAMFIRLPNISEVDEIVEICHLSLNSQIEVIERLDLSARRQGKTHQVILMDEIGDLREGIWSREKLIDTALHIENNLSAIELVGIGTNLGCYGGVRFTREKMTELVDDAKAIENAIGRKLKYISGGGTFALQLVIDGDMPKEVNFLRIGEAMLLARDIKSPDGSFLNGTHRDAFLLQMEVIEVEIKPSYPQGELSVDGFGLTNEFEDKGLRKRAILAGGKVDYGYPKMLFPKDEGIEILGASSDHTILDIEDAERDIKVGDILEFEMSYANMVYAMSNEDVDKVTINRIVI